MWFIFMFIFQTSLPTTFQEVFDNIYEYIDRLFAIVRPKKLLFLAIGKLLFIYDYLFPLFQMKSTRVNIFIYGRIKIWGKRRRNKLRST